MHKNLVTTVFISVAIIMVTLMLLKSDNDGQASVSRSKDMTEFKITQVRVEDDDGVYVTLSSGAVRKIASFVKFNDKNFDKVRNYQSAQISPNNNFVAIDGYAFEDGVVEIYDVKTGILHEEIYGQINEWTDTGLLKIKACDLSGESCVDKVSVSSKSPWVVKEVPTAATGTDDDNKYF